MWQQRQAQTGLGWEFCVSFHHLQVPKPVGRVVLVSSLGAVFIEAIYCHFAQSKTIKDFHGLCLQIPFGVIHVVWFTFPRKKCSEAFWCIAEHVQNNSV